MTLSSAEPRMQVRVPLMRDVRDAALGIDAHRFAPIVRRLDAAIAQASISGWASATPFIDVHDEILAVAGRDTLYEVSRRSVAMTLRGPVFASLIKIGRPLMARKPTGFLSWLPATRTMVLRGFGDCSLRESPGGVLVVVQQCPLADSESFRVSHCGVIRGLLDDAGRNGEVIASVTGDTVTFDAKSWPRSA